MTAPPPSPPGWYVTSSTLLHEARAHWRFVLALAALGAGVAAGTVLLLPSRYKAAAAFQAESTPSQLGQALGLGGGGGGGALAGLLGGQLGGLQLAGNPANPLLFADLLRTDAVLRHVVNAGYAWEGAVVPLSTIYGLAAEPQPLRDYRAIKRLRRALSVDVGIRTGIVRFEIEAKSPELALAVAETTLAALNDANIRLRQQRASAERSYTAARSADARLSLADAESTLAAFHQRNRNLETSPTLQLEEARLRRTVDMAQQVYTQLRLQEEQAALQELRNTPSISVIDPPTLPAKRSWPNRRLAVVGGLLIGLTIACGRLAWQRQVG